MLSYGNTSGKCNENMATGRVFDEGRHDRWDGIAEEAVSLNTKHLVP